MAAAIGLGSLAGIGYGISQTDAFKKPKAPKVSDKSIDESALAARKREVDRARNAGKAGSLYTRLGGSGSSGGMTVARSALSGGSTLG